MPKKVLVIEDEAPLIKAVRDKLEKEGLQVVEAKNGKLGLEAALEEKPDLILLDIIMPVMDGITMLEELRKDEWGKEVPVVLLTNLYESEKVSEAMQKGAHDYLVKSDWKLVDVVKKVKEKLSI